ncbi:uncharacterized protein LOC124420118 [Lucilia cuprina]|uniref:uncharacterized protein LOC124420118 n=1 Tax=Lucilia cuprina TaxID=7375 RepID=UPI001F06BFBF|nr:uncharacterized protein LOC124420118 [Lucilia cuprina]
MAAIRILKKKFEDTILQADNVVIEYIQAYKDKKPETLKNLKWAEVVKCIRSVELLANKIVRKSIQIRRQLEAMNKHGMDARKEAEKYYQYKSLSQAARRDHDIFLERTNALLPVNVSSFTFSSSS